MTKGFRLKITNAVSTDTIKYKSADKKIATVTSEGYVTGVAKGTTKITATLTDKSKKTQTFTCTVTVKEMYVPQITDISLVQDGDLILDSNPSIKLRYRIDKTTKVEIEVYNLLDELMFETIGSVTRNKLMSFTWKCKDMDGNIVPADGYYFKVISDTATVKSDIFMTLETNDFEKGTGSKKILMELRQQSSLK